VAPMSVRLPHSISEHDAVAILSWAEETFGSGLILTSSFENPVLPYLVSRHAPSAEIVLIDTQYLFPETLQYAHDLSSRFGFSLRIQQPAVDVVPDDLWATDIESCCERRKVRPLLAALEGKQAWISGLRRSDGFERANAPIVAKDLARDVIKINPLALWDDEDVESFIRDNDLPVNPLSLIGYASIGCWPCTRAILPGESRRDGRWAGQEKTECGLHTSVVEVRTDGARRIPTSTG